MNSEEFKKNAAFRSRLQEILKDEVFQKAVTIAKARMDARVGTADVNPVLAASKYQQQAGANDLLDTLNFLTTVAKERPTLQGKRLAESLDDLPK